MVALARQYTDVVNCLMYPDLSNHEIYHADHSINAKKERITIMVGGGTYLRIFILIYALFFVQI